MASRGRRRTSLTFSPAPLTPSLSRRERGKSSRAASAWHGIRARLRRFGHCRPDRWANQPVARRAPRGIRRRIARTDGPRLEPLVVVGGRIEVEMAGGRQADRAEQLQVAVAGPREPIEMALGNDHAHLAGGPHAGDPLHRAPLGVQPAGALGGAEEDAVRAARGARAGASPGGEAGQDLAGQRVELPGLVAAVLRAHGVQRRRRE